MVGDIYVQVVDNLNIAVCMHLLVFSIKYVSNRRAEGWVRESNKKNIYIYIYLHTYIHIYTYTYIDR